MTTTNEQWLPASIKLSVAFSVFLILPSYLDSVSRLFERDLLSLSYLASIELAGFAFATILSFILSSYSSIKINERLTIMVLIVSQLASAWCDDLSLFAALRLIAGLSAGLIAINSFESLARQNNPDAAFAKAIATQMAYGAALLFGLPALIDVLGLNAIFLVFSILSFGLLILPQTQERRRQSSPNTKQSDVSEDNRSFIIVGLVAIFLVMVSHSGTWSILGLEASKLGISAQNQGNILATGTLFSIVGALLANYFADFENKRMIVIIAIVLQMFVIELMIDAKHTWQYVGSVCLFMLNWNFVLPYVIGALARIDYSGQSLRFALALQTLGAAIGPSVILENWLETELQLLMLLSLLAVYPLFIKRHLQTGKARK
ncbi:MFS transporter [Alginatibacterium sediminis]|uniref:MFS transporter n=1 Tax=Alginatibacterium sediminis TaxID=2164068 RepID=A0A420EDL0_9ALTE|nr:MFS transporter [Alginatibacterium sediminis]RKF18761.1 MFS transporter [Alginatibacterium sediminis]